MKTQTKSPEQLKAAKTGFIINFFIVSLGAIAVIYFLGLAIIRAISELHLFGL